MQRVIKKALNMNAALLLVLIFHFSVYSSFISAKEAPEVVRDAAGKILRTDSYYYILPANSGSGGGLTLDSVREDLEPCPQGVVQEPYEYADGFSVKFYPVNLKKGVIRVSTDVNIEFSALSKCGETNVWKHGDYDHDMEKCFVGVDGVVGNPGVHTLSNWFKIEKMENGYKLVYCPSVCTYCYPLCQDVGIVYHNGKSRLAFTDSEPLNVIFKKA